MKSQNIFVALVIIIFAIITGAYLVNKPRVAPAPTTDDTSLDKVALFSCDMNKSISATFHLPADKAVDLTLGDGRTMSLLHAISASGARYANADESFVFWNKGETAFITENGKNTFENCQQTGGGGALLPNVRD
jgi:membrane-bound inhibitor of C-type lysozyme